MISLVIVIIRWIGQNWRSNSRKESAFNDVNLDVDRWSFPGALLDQADDGINFKAVANCRWIALSINRPESVSIV